MERTRFKMVQANVLVAFFSCALLGFAIIFRFQHSLTTGRAGAEPGYDDITYLLDGRYRAFELHRNFIHGLYLWVINPPHSPTSSLIAAIGNLVFGSNASAIYFLNALIVSGVCTFLFYKATKSMHLALVASTLVIISPIGPMLMFGKIS